LFAGPTEDGVFVNVMIHCFRIPFLTITVLSPGRFVLRRITKYEAHAIYANHKTQRAYARIHDLCSIKDIYILGIIHGALLYSRALYPPSGTSGIHALPAPDNDDIRCISAAVTRVLWHHRLGHVHHQKLCELHTHEDGIPKISMPLDIETCPTCAMCKTRRADHGDHDTHHDATIVCQGISLNWSFICQRSKNMERCDKFYGVNGETAYLMIPDHKTA
jgi:hypothetical protein